MKNVAIFVENHVHDSELWVPYYRMLEQGYSVTLVGPKADTASCPRTEIR